MTVTVNTAALVGAAFVLGFYLCFFTLVRRAMNLARDCHENETRAVAKLKEFAAELDRIFQPKAKNPSQKSLPN